MKDPILLAVYGAQKGKKILERGFSRSIWRSWVGGPGHCHIVGCFLVFWEPGVRVLTGSHGHFLWISIVLYHMLLQLFLCPLEGL
jgi:hypothetical protein